MKKVFLFAVTILTVLLASCSGSYDQAKVDAIDMENPDFKVVIEQAGYALDDLENAKDPDKWAKENEKEFNALIDMSLSIAGALEGAYPEFPEELRDEADELNKRMKKVFSKILPEINGSEKIETE